VPELILIRGAQGSGKSTLATAIVNAHSYENYAAKNGSMYMGKGISKSYVHFEADQFWYLLGHGSYAFDPAMLGKAHKWCQDGVQQAINKSQNVIVSNTFTTRKELQPYLDMAKAHNEGLDDSYRYTVQEIICRGEFANTHGVPQDAVNKKRAGLEL
jgi:ABC-type dipeptide/oligopeptide/nickel transport system ATPase component